MTAKRINPCLTRTIELDRAAVNADARTVDISFSSEYPVERYFGVEILDHGEGCVDLSRLNAGAPLLVNHDPEKQCGVVETAKVSDRRGIATVRFGRGEFADEIFKDVQDGIRRLVSVGYRLCDQKKTVRTETDGKETYRFQSWQPYELSIVPIPADPTVGIGRAEQNNQTADFELPEPMNRNLLLNATATDGGGIDVAKAERTRAGEIRKTANQFRSRVKDIDELVDAALDNGTPVDEFNRSLLAKIATAPVADNAGQTRIDTTPEALSVGEALIRSGDYKAFNEKRTNKFSLEVRGTLPQLMNRATFLTTGLTSIQKVPGVVMLEQQPLRLADLFSQGTTSSTTIRFTKESSYTNSAAAVAEEGQKPEATLALSESDVTVKKLAVVQRVSDEMFADYEYAQSYVNGRLLWSVAAKEDSELLNADGTSSRITGLLSVSGIQTQAYASNLADSVHKAITKVRTVGFFEPDAIVMNPSDWQNLRLTKDSNGQYYSGGPFGGAYGQGGYTAMGPLWGLPVVLTTNLAQGTAIVGAFKMGATLFRKGGVTIETTNSDASDFVYNRIAIRAEERLCLVPYRPLAFCTVTGIPAQN